MFSQHLKRIDQVKAVKETDDGNIASYDLEVLKSVREKLNTLEQEQEKIVLKSKEDVDKILENLDVKQVKCPFLLCLLLIALLLRYLNAFTFKNILLMAL